MLRFHEATSLRHGESNRCNMNRRKKGIQILKARAKRAKAKLAPKNKTTYISKAERAAQAEEPDLGTDTVSEV